MTNKTRITGRGGAGRGQGRKALPDSKKRKQYNVRMHPEILEYLRKRPEPVAQLIEQALIAQYGIKLTEDAEPVEP